MNNSADAQKRITNAAITIIAVGVVFAGLILGKTWLIPLVLAILIWNLLEAVISNISKIGIGGFYIPRWFGLIIAIIIVSMSFMAIFQILVSQGEAINRAWPNYVDRFQAILSGLLNWMGTEAAATVQKLIDEMDFLSQLPNLLGSMQSFLATVVLIIIYVAFLLAEQGAGARKFRSLFVKEEDAQIFGEVLSSISKNVRRYVWIKTIMSLVTAGLSYVLLKYLGVDFPETWALLIMLLNYIPTIGSIIGVIFPSVLALVQFDTFGPFFTIVTGLTAIQLVIGNIVDPMFMGRSLNISSFTIMATLTLWGLMWGIIGMFLAVPITVVIIIVASNVPSWRWLAILLSKDGHIPEISGRS